LRKINKSEPSLVINTCGGSPVFGILTDTMPRPKIKRRLQFNPDVDYFKPRGISLRDLDEVELFMDEVEAIKLYLVDGLDQKESAKKMNISQPTFARIISSATKKMAEALIKGKAIRIDKSKE